MNGGSHDSAMEEEVDEDPENILGEPLGTVAMTNNYCDKKVLQILPSSASVILKYSENGPRPTVYAAT